ALRTRRSMQIRKAASVLPDPVGAEISVVRPARISGQPCSCGSVGEPKRPKNHSATSGCAQASATGISPKAMTGIVRGFLDFRQSFAQGSGPGTNNPLHAQENPLRWTGASCASEG